MACTDTIALENIEYCPEEEIAAGISPTEIFACPVSKFTTIAEPPALNVATTLAEAATISDPHTFTGDDGFFKINILPETGMVDSENQGEKGNKTNVNNFSGTLPGITARNLGLIRKYQNVGMIFIVTQIDGKKRQLGSKNSPAYLSEASASTGQKPGDINGIPVKFSDVQAFQAPIYTGVITEFTPPTP